MSLVKTRLLTLVVLGALGGLGAWLTVWQRDKSERDEKAETKSKHVFSLQDDDADAVTEIRLATPQDSFRIVRDRALRPQAWKIVEPVDSPADDTTIDGLLHHLLQLERTLLVGERQGDGRDEDAPVTPPEQLDIFGLDPPRFRVTLTAKKKDDETAAPTTETLLVGKKNRFNDNIYVKREGSPQVVTVPGALEYQVDKKLFNLRERRLAVLEQDAVKRLDVSVRQPTGAGRNATRRYTVERRDDDFYLGDGDAAAGILAERYQITGLLSTLTGLSATEFVSERATPEQKEVYGISQPRARLVLTLAPDAAPDDKEPDARADAGDQDLTVTLLLSQVGDGDAAKHYGMVAGEGPILELPDDRALKKIDVSLDSLRDKKLLRFERDEVTSLSLRTAKTVLTLERSRADSNKDENDENDENGFVEYTWAMTQPEAAKAQRSKVTSLLYKLWSLKAERIVLEHASVEQLAAKGLDEPSLTVEMHTEDEGLVGRLAFGDVEGPEGAQEQYATSSAGTRLDLVLRATVEEISSDPADYRETEDGNESNN